MRKKRGISPLFLFLLFEIYFLKFKKWVDFWRALWYTIIVVKGKQKKRKAQEFPNWPIKEEKRKQK